MENPWKFLKDCLKMEFYCAPLYVESLEKGPTGLEQREIWGLKTLAHIDYWDWK